MKIPRSLAYALVGTSFIGNGLATYTHREDGLTIEGLNVALKEEQTLNKTQAEQITKLLERLEQEEAITNNLQVRVEKIEGTLDHKITFDQVIDVVEKIKRSSVELEGQALMDISNTRKKEWGPTTASGSIIIIGDNRYILTNGHNLEGMPKDETFHVKLYNGSDFKEPVKFDAKPAILKTGKKAYSPKNEHDMLLLAIPKDVQLPEGAGIKFRDLEKEELKVGEPVITTGSPYGARDTVSFGIVSHSDKDLSSSKKNKNHHFQTDAVINQGSSGGGSYDIKGRYIGMPSYKIGDEELGIVIRVDYIKQVLEEWEMQIEQE